MALSAASIILLLAVAYSGSHAFAQDEIDSSYITAEIDVHSKSIFNFTNNAVFAQGESVDFYGYVDGYTQIENDPQAIFAVTIADPEKETIFQQQFTAEEIGGQDIINFSYEIPANAAFGRYEVNFTVEKQGHKSISQHTSDPLVGYRAPSFFVSWTEQDIIDVSDKYKLKIVEPARGEAPIKFGSRFTIKAELCPSPIDHASSRGFYELRLGHTVLERDQGIITVHARLEPLNEEQAIGVVRDVAVFSEQDGCDEHFEIPSGLLPASGKWSISATAQWLDKDNTTSVFRVQSESVTFDVAGTLFRTNNIVGINVDDEYSDALPMDWSADGKTILFSYQRPGEAAKLAILHLDDPDKTTTDFGNLTVAADTTNPEIYQSLEQARFGADGHSIYFVLDSGAYRYRIGGEPAGHDLTINSAERLSNVTGFIDILPDGRIAYISAGKLMSSQPDGQNAQEIATIENSHDFDISSDGKKVLYTKILEWGYLTSSSVIAYYDIETGEEHVIPNIQITCEGGARWAPNDYNFVFNDATCWRAPGGGLIMTDIHGSFQDPIVPTSDDNPNHYVFSADGHSILIGFGSYYEDQARVYMGPSSDFYIMTLAQPVPEFGLMAIIPIIGAVALAGVAFIRMQHSTKSGK